MIRMSIVALCSAVLCMTGCSSSGGGGPGTDGPANVFQSGCNISSRLIVRAERMRDVLAMNIDTADTAAQIEEGLVEVRPVRDILCAAAVDPGETGDHSEDLRAAIVVARGIIAALPDEKERLAVSIAFEMAVIGLEELGLLEPSTWVPPPPPPEPVPPPLSVPMPPPA